MTKKYNVNDQVQQIIKLYNNIFKDTSLFMNCFICLWKGDVKIIEILLEIIETGIDAFYISMSARRI